MSVRVIANKDLWLNADADKVVLGSSDQAAFLLARKGREIPPNYEGLVTRTGNPKKARKPAADKNAEQGDNK